MLARLKNELLNSDIDLRTSEVSEEQGLRFRVTAKSGGARMLLSAIFAIPCVFLLLSAFSTGSLHVLFAALLFCPLLALLALLFGFALSEKELDRSRNMGLKSLRLFGFTVSESDRLPGQGMVILEGRISGGGKNTPGGHRRYSITLSPCVGFGFVVFNDYGRAQDFAKRLGRFLDYPLENKVPPVYQR